MPASASLYKPARPGGAVTEALCWAHARRGFFELADLARARKGPPSPMALEAVRQIDAIFAQEREINGRPAEERLAYRRAHVAPLVGGIRGLDAHRAPQAVAPCRGRQGDGLHAEALARLHPLPRGWEDLPINNAAERALRGVALGRKAWLFCGSDRGGLRAAVMYTLIGTAKLNDVDPQAWLADVLERIASLPVSRLPELLPWNWRPAPVKLNLAAA